MIFGRTGFVASLVGRILVGQASLKGLSGGDPQKDLQMVAFRAKRSLHGGNFVMIAVGMQ